MEFFIARGHTFVPSSPSVPLDDPTLLFTNAGMNQFKPLFLGQADPATAMGRLKRAVNTQKCIRAGGKHNDLEDVGKDTYHHTFFEMLGNWSFGDYFKQEAIDWSWELLTKVYGINPDALYATYFGGNPAAGMPADDETRELWLRHLPAGRVLPGSMKDNFWMMGDTGPCGPCTEIHVDRLTAGGEGKRDAAGLVNSGDPMVLEVWNNVFIQFNAEYGAQGLAALEQWDKTPEAERARLPYASRAQVEAKFRTLAALPAKHVDTGMGFERLVSVLHNVRSNYDTDVFAPLFVAIERITGATAYSGRLGEADIGNKDTAYRVIADHIRTLTFAITDGATPSNEGRGYVLRRILRRAVRYGRQTLGAKTGFFSQLVPVLVEQMHEAFPELGKNPGRVQEIVREEEESFSRTLDRGIVLFDEVCARTLAGARLAPHHQARNQVVSVSKGASGWVVSIGERDGGMQVDSLAVSEVTPRWTDAHFGPSRVVSGADAFKLYDTFGFPVDLTNLMAEERGLTVDSSGFEVLVEEARQRARAGGRFSAEQGGLGLSGETIAKLKHMGVKATDDSGKFAGREVAGRIQAIWNGSSFDQTAGSAAAMHQVAVILDHTNHYAEMGGQVGDHGVIKVTRGVGREHSGDFVVQDTKAFGGYVIHIGRVHKGELHVGDEVIAAVDHHRRAAVSSNHTATHLMNLALREVLGAGVEQKGSLVAHDRLRFDFSHGRPVGVEELARIESLTSAAVKADVPVYAELMPLEQAKKIAGVRAVFGEAYPDPVRVVSVGRAGRELHDAAGATGTSAEFCGGVHVARTGEISSFTIVSEEGVAKGVRRVTALTGVPAMAALAAAAEIDAKVRSAGGLRDEALAAEVKAIGAEMETLTLPVVAKQRISAALAQVQEKVRQASKAASAGRAAEVASAAKSLAESSEWEMMPFIVSTIEAGSDREALSAAIEAARQARPRHAVLLISPDQGEGKLTIIASVPDALQKRGLKAGDWVRDAAAACGGRGGGRPDSAQGGGTDLSKVKDALNAARAHAAAKVPS